MAEWGGYRRPSDPAPVSGPGALSWRTDGGPTQMTPSGGAYGERKAYEEVQSAAPLRGQATAAAAPSPSPLPPPTPINAPTQRPEQPVTAGADAGPGDGFGALGIPDAGDEAEDLRRRYGPVLPILIRKAADPRSSAAFRDQVRYVVSVIG